MIIITKLLRVEESFNHGTFGLFLIQAKVFCVTLEPRDEENAQNISSIPAQQYECQRVISPRFGETFEIMNVPGRSDVLFHGGNIDDHTLGCILLGQHYGKLKGDRAVLNSGNTFKSFMDLMTGYDKFHLTIKEHY